VTLVSETEDSAAAPELYAELAVAILMDQITDCETRCANDLYYALALIEANRLRFRLYAVLRDGHLARSSYPGAYPVMTRVHPHAFGAGSTSDL
jgi:hypothetical protein